MQDTSGEKKKTFRKNKQYKCTNLISFLDIVAKTRFRDYPLKQELDLLLTCFWTILHGIQVRLASGYKLIYGKDCECIPMEILTASNVYENMAHMMHQMACLEYVLSIGLDLFLFYFIFSNTCSFSRRWWAEDAVQGSESLRGTGVCLGGLLL